MDELAKSFVNFPIFFVTWLTFFAAAALSFALQIYYNRDRISLMAFIRHCFPFDSWSSKSARIDVKVYLLGKLINKLYAWMKPICTVLVATAVSRALSSHFPGHAAIQPTYLIVAGCSFALFLVVEFSNYLTHYMQHKIPILWEIHKVHHSATFLNPLTSKRAHPLGFILDELTSGALSGVPAGVFGFLYGFSVPEIVFLYACASKIGTIATLDSLKHSHFPVTLGWFDRVLISPHMHQIHHSSHKHHWDRNFGINLSIYDWIFGTAYRPSKNEDIVYGIGNGEDHDYDKLTGVYFGPLLKMWRLVAGPRVATEQPVLAATDVYPAPAAYKAELGSNPAST